MPPKNNFKWRHFKSKNDLAEKQKRSKDTNKQVTISKFFASTESKCKRKANTDDSEVTVIIDDSEDDKSNIKEEKIASPLKKRQKIVDVSLCRQSTNLAIPSTSTVESSSSSAIKDQFQLSKKTKDKLDSFSMTEFSGTGQKQNIHSDFDFTTLKRKKAAHLPDINVDLDDLQDTVKLNNDESLEINNLEQLTSTNTDDSKTSLNKNTESGTRSISHKLSKFSSRKNEGRTDSVKSNLKEKCEMQMLTKTSSSMKYTQLEQQFIDIKQKYPDAVLFVECGYKYRFFGNDAEIAAEVLKIYCHLDHNFMTASIPVHRLFVHVRRLVSAGYKVGVVKQMETAALKAAGSNKNTPFTRQLTALYTKSTLLGEENSATNGDSVSMATNYLMCICDHVKEKHSKNNTIGVVAVQPSTGDVIYDSFEDTDSRSELETRLAHIQPVEVILSHNASVSTNKLLTGLQTISFHDDDRMRIEKMDNDVFEYSTALVTVSEITADTNTDSSRIQDFVNLPKAVICCLSALITYLRDFNLHKILCETSNFCQFSTQSKYMQLNGSTLRNLEIFRNATNGKEKGSLFWALNKTVTRPGARLLRSWLSHPLLSHRDILSRQSAVSDLLNGNIDLQKLSGILSKLPDLEKGLSTAYHKKCSTSEFYMMCKSLDTVHDEFKLQSEAMGDHVTSVLLRDIISQVPDLLSDIKEFSTAIVEKAAKENDKTELFTNDSMFPSVVKCKTEINNVTKEIHDHRRYVRLTVRQPSLEFTTVLGTEFLVAVKHSNISLVPNDWIKISSTKAVSRFHTPYIVEKYRELLRLREQLLIDCNQAWIEFLQLFGSKYQCHRKAIHLISTLDCLLSLVNVAQHFGYCRPDMCEDSVVIDIQDGRHPVIQELLCDSQQYVPNNTHLTMKGQRVMIITGPNMGGKSCYIKQVAILAIMAQIGSYIPAREATLGLLDAIYTRMGAADNIYKGRSTFMVELEEASEIMAKATSRSLVILDELGRGTSTHDGVAIAHATLNFFINQPKCLTLFVTHYPLLADLENMYPDIVGNFHMSFLLHDQEENNTEKETITFLYQLVKGVAARSYGLNVATLASIPSNIVSVATHKSREMERNVLRSRKPTELFKKIFHSSMDNYKNLFDTIPNLT